MNGIVLTKTTKADVIVRSFAPHLKICLIVLAISCAPTLSTAEERCGWLINPSPNNFWLKDRDQEWALMVQGGLQDPGDYSFDPPASEELPATVEGEENIPIADRSNKKFWHLTGDSASYGYGCTCLKGTFDATLQRAKRIDGGTILPLARCRADRKLPKPD